MKRLLFGVLATALLLTGLGTAVQAANTDNFTITQLEAKYVLGRDGDNHSTLRATWRITADFPPQQNRGIAPVFVKTYDKHSTDFQLQSVTDEHGQPLEYMWHGDELRIGNKNIYVSGLKTYVITYTQRNVTKHHADTGKTELYWDFIGHQWRVPIQQATVKLELDETLVKDRRGEAFCYYGALGSRQRCAVSDEGKRLTMTVPRLAAQQGVTAALGFEAGAFAAYQKPLKERLVEIWQIVQIPASLLAGAMIFWLIWWYRWLTGRKRELRPIPPEYIPPRESVLVSGYILQQYDQRKGSPMVAQLLDLAVRHYIKLYEVKKGSFLSPAQYKIEVTKKLDGLWAEEQELLKDMFGGSLPHVGQQLPLKRLQNNLSYVQRTMDDDRNLRALIRGEYGLCGHNKQHQRLIKRRAIWLGVATIVLLSPAMAIATAIAFGLSFGYSLTDKGLVLRRYLAGLKVYIGVAEADRLAMLQSPEGATKTKVDTTDDKQLVRLYERVLPYAVLFGQEKQWTKQLGAYYEQTHVEPDWFVGRGAFNAAVFASSMNSLSSAATSVSNYSSSSGGSSGGGFAGGGGGGGGGGGW